MLSTRCFGRDGFGLRALAPGVVALFSLATGCVNLTPPWAQVTGADAALDIAAGSGGQSALDGARGASGGAGGTTGPIDVGPTPPDTPSVGGNGGTIFIDSGGVGGAVDADISPPDVPVGSATGGAGGTIDSPRAGTGGAAADAAPDAPMVGTGGSAADAPLDTAAGGRGGSGGTTTGRGGTGGGSTARGGSGGIATGTGGAGTGGSGTGGRGTGGSGTGGAGTGGAGTGGSGTGGVGTGGTTSSDAGVCSGYVAPDAGGLTQGLVAYYPCESASGALLPDQSGNAKDASLVTGTGGTVGYSFVTGRVNNALALTKASQGHVKLPVGILAGACEMTVATWVYLNTNNTTTSTWQRIWDFGTSSTSGYMFVAASTNLAAPNNAVRFTISASGNGPGVEQIVSGPAPLPTLAWHHVAVVLGSAGAVLYLDGTQVGANAAVTLRPADLGNTPNNYIGRSQYSGDPYLDGDIDEFRVYNRALSLAEIQALASGS